MFLSDAFLSSLVAEIDSDDYVGILLGGSYARGEATWWSDVDIACIVPDGTRLRRKRFFYREGKLVSIGTKSIEGIRAQLAKPETAIWVAHGIGDCRVLVDKDGSVTALLEEVRGFTWEPLREVADRNASFWLMMTAEMVQKVANELTKGDELAVSYAVARLFAELTLIMAIARGVLVRSDNTYYRQVEEAAGPRWAQRHRAIAGADGPIPIPEQAREALHLYCETARLLHPSILAEHREVVDETVKRIERSGLLPGSKK
jgi:Nucleotidyltransferase domain